MTAFVLPDHYGKPLEIVDFHVDLVVSPPEVKENIIHRVDPYISTQTGKLQINYKDATIDEGHLNIYICRFSTGRCYLHVFGKMKGREFRTEREISESNSNSTELNRRIRYVLVRSRNILRAYYLNNNLESLENHLLAFLLPLK